jgi:hypothetical protein
MTLALFGLIVVIALGLGAVYMARSRAESPTAANTLAIGGVTNKK